MIKEKLDILKETGVIDTEVYNYMYAVMDCLREEGIDVEGHPPVEPFLVHLAMAAARQKTDEPAIAPMDPLICDDIKQSPNFPRAKAIWEKLMAFSPVSFRDEELDYCYLHICTMLQ